MLLLKLLSCPNATSEPCSVYNRIGQYVIIVINANTSLTDQLMAINVANSTSTSASGSSVSATHPGGTLHNSVYTQKV
jgi:hypothetical protein